MRAICQTVYGIRYKTHILHMTAEEYGGPGPGSGSKRVKWLGSRYVGNLALFSGTKSERRSAAQKSQWSHTALIVTQVTDVALYLFEHSIFIFKNCQACERIHALAFWPTRWSCLCGRPDENPSLVFAIGFILPFHSCTVSLLKEFSDCLALLCMLCQHATTDIALSSIIDEAGKTGMIARWWRRVS